MSPLVPKHRPGLCLLALALSAFVAAEHHQMTLLGRIRSAS